MSGTMTTTLLRVDTATVTTTDPAAEAADAPCRLCSDTGWADAWEAYAGSPPLTWCPSCLGSGLEDCDGCDGYGAVADPVSCPACDGELFAASA